MATVRDYRSASYLIILLGCAAAAVASVVPFYTVGYKVDALALAAVLTPFVIYGMFIESLRGPWLLASGLVLLGVTVIVVISERYLHYDGYRDATLYWVPLLAVAVVLPIAYVLQNAIGDRPRFGINKLVQNRLLRFDFCEYAIGDRPLNNKQ